MAKKSKEPEELSDEQLADWAKNFMGEIQAKEKAKARAVEYGGRRRSLKILIRWLENNHKPYVMSTTGSEVIIALPNRTIRFMDTEDAARKNAFALKKGVAVLESIRP